MDPKRKLPDADPITFEGGDPPCWAHLFDDTPDDAPAVAPRAGTGQDDTVNDAVNMPPAEQAPGRPTAAPPERSAEP
jgi:hypothetical protein